MQIRLNFYFVFLMHPAVNICGFLYLQDLVKQVKIVKNFFGLLKQLSSVLVHPLFFCFIFDRLQF